MNKPQEIPFKGYNLPRIAKWIDKGQLILSKHLNTNPVGDEFSTFIHDILSCFPDKLRFDAVFASVMHLAGTQLTPEVIKETLWRIAGNFETLSTGKPVPIWLNQSILEWCPVAIVKADPGYGYNEEYGGFYQYRVMAGTPAGLKFTLFWNIRYAKFIAKELGFKRTRKKRYKFTDIKELVQMQLYLLFDPELSKEGKPGSYYFKVPPSCAKRNKTILMRRFREDPCPLEYSLQDLPCYQCPMGYDKCNAGCHPRTYTMKFCPRCTSESWFDPLGRGVICVECDK